MQNAVQRYNYFSEYAKKMCVFSAWYPIIGISQGKKDVPCGEQIPIFRQMHNTGRWVFPGSPFPDFYCHQSPLLGILQTETYGKPSREKVSFFKILRREGRSDLREETNATKPIPKRWDTEEREHLRNISEKVRFLRIYEYIEKNIARCFAYIKK